MVVHEGVLVLGCSSRYINAKSFTDIADSSRWQGFGIGCYAKLLQLLLMSFKPIIQGAAANTCT